MDRTAFTPPPDVRPGLPIRLTRVLGREAVVSTLDDLLKSRSLVVVVGPGGIGKSTVALAVAEVRSTTSDDIVAFADLSHCSDAGSVAPFTMAALEASGWSSGQDAGQRVLLVLDNCEHVVEAVAELMGSLAEINPALQVLATSREVLRIKGEKVFRLQSLDVPPMDEIINADDALGFSAVQLFVERASVFGFELDETDVLPVVTICQQLDGIPLALELAAARMGVLSAKELATRLDERFQLLAQGRRTALPRQQTLAATLDWSFDTLTVAEGDILLALSSFRGPFTLDGAVSIVEDAEHPEGMIIQIVADLVSKSLIAVQPNDAGVSYRLLETTRRYCWEKLLATDARDEVQRRHALLSLQMLASAHDDLLELPRAIYTKKYGAIASDIQAAVDWALSDDQYSELASELVSAAAALADQLFMRQDYLDKIKHLIAAPGKGERDTLKLTLPLTIMQAHVRGELRDAKVTAERALAVQDEAGLELPEVLAARFGTAFIEGDYPLALRLGDQLRTIALRQDDDALVMLSDRVRSQAMHYLGDFDEAEKAANRVLASPYEFLPYSINNHRVSLRGVLARCATVRGQFDKARTYAMEAAELSRDDTPFTRCLNLGLSGIPVAIWLGDEILAKHWLGELRDLAERHGFRFWQIMGLDLARGVDRIWGEPPFEPHNHSWEEIIGPTNLDTLPTFAPSLLIPKSVDRVRSGTVGWNAAEIMRIEAINLASRSIDDALEHLDNAEALACAQGAKLWQSRITATRAQLVS